MVVAAAEADSVRQQLVGIVLKNKGLFGVGGGYCGYEQDGRLIGFVVTPKSY
jgi:hypothetical protein